MRSIPARRSLRAGGVALVAAAALTGCQWTSVIQTDQGYEPADGTTVRVGDLEVANVVVVSAGKGAPGNVTGLAINHSAQPLQVQVRAADNAGQAGGPAVAVPAGGTAQLTTPGGQAVTLPSVEPMAGSHITLTIASAEGQTAVDAPVLPPEQYYAPYAPQGGAGEATAGSTASPNATATGSPGTEPGASPTTGGDEPAAPTATTAPAN